MSCRSRVVRIRIGLTIGKLDLIEDMVPCTYECVYREPTSLVCSSHRRLVFTAPPSTLKLRNSRHGWAGLLTWLLKSLLPITDLCDGRIKPSCRCSLSQYKSKPAAQSPAPSGHGGGGGGGGDPWVSRENCIVILSTIT